MHDSRLMRKSCKMLGQRRKRSIRQAEAKGAKKRKRDEKEKWQGVHAKGGGGRGRKVTQPADRRDCEGEGNSGSEEVSGRKWTPLALFQEKERKARKFKEARLERKEAVDEREQKRMGRNSGCDEVEARGSQKIEPEGDAVALEYVQSYTKAGRPGKLMGTVLS
jgi:hypothetical protein